MSRLSELKDKATAALGQAVELYQEKKEDGTIDAATEQAKATVQLGVAAAKAKINDLRQ